MISTQVGLVTNFEDTIAAISTPPGEGGVGIVRLSGKSALAISAQLFRSSREKDICTSSQQVFHGHIVNAAEETLDEVLLHVMRAPHSYTREDVIEINCHGGAAPLNAVLEAVLTAGARLAAPGEFTQRAFLNGRIDLVQAEAVIDQIRARTRAGLQAANAAASGTLSQRLHAISDQLAYALAHIEAAVDFPEDDLPELVTPELFEHVRAAYDQMRHMLATADAGRLCREGAVLAIVGRPNVGKSSLFNALLRDTRAIVSKHAGTTRDRIEEYITLSGIPVKLIDTAGLRQTDNEVERIGVALAREALENANMILFVLDAAAPAEEEDVCLAQELAELTLPTVVVLNKADLVDVCVSPACCASFADTVSISALTGDGLKKLEDILVGHLLGGVNLDAGQAMLNRLHQKESLRRSIESVERLLDDTTLSPEFLALELRDALHALGEITGETTPEDILDKIFSTFCIGK